MCVCECVFHSPAHTPKQLFLSFLYNQIEIRLTVAKNKKTPSTYSKPQKQTRFSNTGISNKQKLKQIVTANKRTERKNR